MFPALLKFVILNGEYDFRCPPKDNGMMLEVQAPLPWTIEGTLYQSEVLRQKKKIVKNILNSRLLKKKGGRG